MEDLLADKAVREEKEAYGGAPAEEAAPASAGASLRDTQRT